MRKSIYDMSVFKERRDRLAKLLNGAALVLPAHPEYVRNHDVHHSYRQDSNLFYLSGFEEPESVFVFRPGRSPETVLFVRDKNPLRETWDGFRYGPKLAQTEFGVDAAFIVDDFEKEAPALLRDVDVVYYSLFMNTDFDVRFRHVIETVKASWGRSGKGNLAIKDSVPLIGEMRVRKTPYEIEVMQKAADISAEAHIEVMKATRPGVSERALHGLFIKEIMERGAAREGYGTIVAGGNNATTLHYVFNDQPLKDGEIMLIDAGAEYHYYSGDITRSYPVSGKFNGAQKRVYQKVLDVQKRMVAMVKPGVTLKQLQETARNELIDVMIDEKLLKGSKDQIVEEKSYLAFYPHGVSHWLGMDVHDAGAYEVNGESRQLEPGFCITVEPGLYVPAHLDNVPEELKGIGIRIEDNIVVTEDGHGNLTDRAPKEVDELEAIIGQG
ncbi:MAG: aminopeptidase P N-terminal domain-containing protein [Pseudobdellovibrionaceae bacterium]|nr:aminopeptidase P N-terminal domain-containing protein [Bdellovibrionales bacterium]USN46669.1 MAG: aminopeptidase P N-terminal domain-containing protein [Pseudobdellovibrionaceae bacterium]